MSGIIAVMKYEPYILSPAPFSPDNNLLNDYITNKKKQIQIKTTMTLIITIPSSTVEALYFYFSNLDCSPENFAFLIPGILESYTRKVCEMFFYKHT